MSAHNSPRCIAIDVGNTLIKCSDSEYTLSVPTKSSRDILAKTVVPFCQMAVKTSYGLGTTLLAHTSRLKKKIAKSASPDETLSSSTRIPQNAKDDAAKTKVAETLQASVEATLPLICITGVNLKVMKRVASLLPKSTLVEIETLLQSRSNPLHSVRSVGTGVDRLLGAIGALSVFSAPVITIDCGTATTINLVDAKKIFRGGVILPGVETQLRSLHTATAALPLVAKEGLVPLVARTSEQAIRSGVVRGSAGAIVSVVQQMLDTAEGAGATVVLSGGNADVLQSLLQTQLNCTHMDECVVKGVLHLMDCYNKDVYGSDSPSRRSGRSSAREHHGSAGTRTQRRN